LNSGGKQNTLSLFCCSAPAAVVAVVVANVAAVFYLKINFFSSTLFTFHGCCKNVQTKTQTLKILTSPSTLSK